MSISMYFNLISVFVAILLAATLGFKSAVLFAVLYVIVYKLPVIYFFLGNNRLLRGDQEKANKYFDKALALPSLPDKYRVSCVYMLILQGNLDRAEKLIAVLSKKRLKPDLQMILKVNQATVLWKRDRLTEAIALLWSLHENYKTTIIYQNLGCFLLFNGEYDKAMELNLEAYEYDATNVGILDNLAQSWYFKKEYDKAAELYKELMEKKPTFPSAYYYYALTLEALGQTQQASDVLRKGLDCKFSFLSSTSKQEIEELLSKLDTEENLQRQ